MAVGMGGGGESDQRSALETSVVDSIFIYFLGRKQSSGLAC